MWLLSIVAHADMADDISTVWRLVDYMAVDYADAVHDGEVTNPGEYEEMNLFIGDIRTRVQALHRSSPELEAMVQKVATDIENKVDATVLRHDAHALGDALMALHPTPPTPHAAPDPARGAAVYAANCASCHGEAGAGDGPAGEGLDPGPVDFTDRERARERSVLALYQVTTQGLEGTAMASFGTLSPAERWDVATYVSTLSFTPDELAKGRALFADPTVRAEIPDLRRWAKLSPTAMASFLPQGDADAVAGFLRHEPSAIEKPANDLLGVARTRLAQSLKAYEDGHVAHAQELALASYLDGFEPVEPLLASHPEARSQVETAMNAYRAALGQKQDLPSVRAAAAAVSKGFDATAMALRPGETDTTSVFIAALLLLVREGLEALLVVVAILGMVRKTGRADLVRDVHLGWSGALLAGVATWVAATTLITISGAQRELIEGLGGLLAAAVLVFVGIWMHDKSMAGRWQKYVAGKVGDALGTGSRLGLIGLVFVVVYREVFETILFYTALWAEGGPGPVLAGLGLGCAILAVLAWVLTSASRRLPLAQFFKISAALMAVLAIILAGKGLAAMQEAGYVPLTLLGLPSFPLLGIHPTIEGLSTQALTAIVLGAGMLWSHRNR